MSLAMQRNPLLDQTTVHHSLSITSDKMVGDLPTVTKKSTKRKTVFDQSINKLNACQFGNYGQNNV